MNLKIKVKQGKVLQLFLKGNVPIKYMQVLAKKSEDSAYLQGGQGCPFSQELKIELKRD